MPIHLPQINLPLPILIHAIGLFIIGTALIFRPGRSTLGITTVAISLSYLTTAYVPIEENVFLHATVPGRMLLGLLAGIRCFSADPRERKTLAVIAVYDGFSGVALGYWLGRFDGKIAGQ